MKLSELIGRIGAAAVSGDLTAEIRGVAYDSRKVQNGYLFVAVDGEHADGHDFAADAVRRGAVAVVHEHDLAGVRPSCSIRVKDTRAALAAVSSAFFSDPSRSLTVIGITGTNGKTTTSYFIKSILEAWGKKAGLIGTIQYMIGPEAFEARHTTPEAVEFQELLRHMQEAGCSHVVSEVSSHALAQKRVDATRFAAAVLTNVTRDHLDYHKSMEEYFNAKHRLFTDLLDPHGRAIVNHDDPYGRTLLASLGRESYSFGLEAGADLVATDISTTFSGLRFTLAFRGRQYPVVSSLIGLPNVYNILSAAGAAAAVGVPWDVILQGIEQREPVRGRFENIDAGQKFLAIIDYAHTEDALQRLIYTARGLTKGRIIAVFGCGGDRDRGKRPAMAAAATKLADAVVITSDNPRSEDPAAIIREIEAGAVRKNYLVEQDRKEAIRRAVRMAGEGDILLVAGKGHETYQEVDGKRFPFDDREVLREAIAQLANSR